MHPSNPTDLLALDRRRFLHAATGALALAGAAAAADQKADAKKKPTTFQIACMTLPYSRFSLDRALQGIKGAGYKYVAWGTSHRDGGKSVPLMPSDATPDR